MPTTGFAVTFPPDWVRYRTPAIDTQGVTDIYAAAADTAFAEIFEECVLFNEDDWLDEYMLFHEEVEAGIPGPYPTYSRHRPGCVVYVPEG